MVIYMKLNSEIHTSPRTVVDEQKVTQELALEIAYPYVLEYLSFREVVLLSRVNKLAHRLAIRPAVWLMMCQKYLYEFPPRHKINKVDPTINYHQEFLLAVKKTTLHFPRHTQLLFKLILENEVVRATNYLVLILSQGFDINQYYPSFQSFLTLASSKGLTAMVELLLAKGAKINHRHNACALPIASRMGYLGVIKILLRHNADINQEDKSSATALFHACAENDEEIAKFLIQNNANVNHAAMFINGKTPLIVAAEQGHENIVALLINAKADHHKTTHLGMSALMFTSQNGHLRTVNILASHNDQINQSDFKNRTALFFAVNKGHNNVVSSLVEKKANPNFRDSGGSSPLSMAKERNNAELVKLLSKSTRQHQG